MSPLIWIGLCIGAAVSAVYLIVALRLKSKPTLENMIHIFLSVLSAVGAVRILGFIICGAFSQLLTNAANTGIFALSGEDAVTLVIASVALGWVSIKLLCKPFQELSTHDKPPK